MKSLSHTFPAETFLLGHYEAVPRQVITTLKEKGFPVIGDWMIRGVTYGALVVTYGHDGVLFIWNDLGEEPPAAEEDCFGLI